MHGAHVLIDVARLLADEEAVGALVARRLPALVAVVADHRVAPPVAVVALGTVKLARLVVELTQIGHAMPGVQLLIVCQQLTA